MIMKHGMMKKSLALTLAAATGFGLAACGSEGSTGKSEDQRFFRADYIESLPDTFTNVNGYVTFVDSTIYYEAYDEDYTKNGLYSYNLDTSEAKTIWEGETQSDNPLDETTYLNRFIVDSEGNAYLYLNSSKPDPSGADLDYSNATYDDIIAYMVEEWGYEQENAEKDWKEYYEEDFKNESGEIDYSRAMLQWNIWQLDRIERNYIQKLDANGNMVYEKEFSKNNDNGYMSCYDIAVDKEDNLFFLMNEWYETSDEYYIQIIDGDGNEKNKVTIENYSSDLIALADGRVAAMGWGNSGNYELQIVDAESGTVGETIDFGNNYIGEMQVLDEKHFLCSENGTIYKFDIDTKEKEKYFSWMDCNISRNNVQGFGMLPDGNIAVYTQNYNYNKGKSTYELAVIREIDASEAANIKTLNLACLSLDYDLEQNIIEFNKSHDNYRISVTEYYDYNTEMDYEDAVNSYMTAMASDSSIDIVLFNGINVYSDIMNFASKGLLIDMYELLDADPEIKREDFIPSILPACEYDEKLVAIPSAFSLKTVVGRASDVGTEQGWTLSEMKALLDSKEPGTRLFYGVNRDWALQMCLNLGYTEFIDLEHTTCDFNNQDFVDVLEIASLFPEEFEWNEEEDQTVLMNTGKVLLAEYQVSDFDEIQLYTEIFGDKLTFIGYPTTNGNGAMLNFNSAYGITKYCEDKDMAWELLREFFLPKDEDDESSIYRYGGMSIRKDDLEKFFTDAMKEEDGGSSWGWGDFMVELKPATQEQVDEVREMINNTTAVNGALSTDVLNIIKEEAAAYFSGQKSAEAVADIIQSRVEVYLSETR